MYIEAGEVEVVNPYTDQRHLPFTLGPTQFLGEISFPNGGSCSIFDVYGERNPHHRVPREAMLTLMSRVPEMSDIIITVYSARRRRQLDERDSSLRLIGEDEDRTVRGIAVFASRNRIPYMSLALGSPEADATTAGCCPAHSRASVGPWAVAGPRPSDQGILSALRLSTGRTQPPQGKDAASAALRAARAPPV